MAATRRRAQAWVRPLLPLLSLSLAAGLVAAGGDIEELGPGGVRDARNADHVFVRVRPPPATSETHCTLLLRCGASPGVGPPPLIDALAGLRLLPASPRHRDGIYPRFHQI